MSNIWRVDKQTVVHSYNGILNCDLQEQTTASVNNMDASQEHYIK